MSDFILRVLSVVADNDIHSDLWWRTDDEYAPVTFFINCNDQFYWACADCETITPDNIAELERACADAKAASPTTGICWAGALFCARVRGMRPQGAYYQNMEGEMWPLFDACGPDRVVETGNTPRPAAPKVRR